MLLLKLHTQKLNAPRLSSMMKSMGGANFSPGDIRITFNEQTKR